eukprot:evm.model.NODE_31053_length_64317_cov_55.547771.3
MWQDTPEPSAPDQVRSQGAIALAMAASGIAALLMEGGATFHSRCKPPRDMASGQSCDRSGSNLSHSLLLIRRKKALKDICFDIDGPQY